MAWAKCLVGARKVMHKLLSHQSYLLSTYSVLSDVMAVGTQNTKAQLLPLQRSWSAGELGEQHSSYNAERLLGISNKK